MFGSKLLNLLAYFPAVLLACLLSFAAAAQQADEPGAETPEPATTEGANTDNAATDDASADGAATDDGEDAAEDIEDIEDIEDADLDEQTYEQDDDDFIPTEEIPADEPIPFPSNI